MIGTGLGLFITRELARANRGEVSYRDADVTGAVFAVPLPGDLPVSGTGSRP